MNLKNGRIFGKVKKYCSALTAFFLITAMVPCALWAGENPQDQAVPNDTVFVANVASTGDGAVTVPVSQQIQTDHKEQIPQNSDQFKYQLTNSGQLEDSGYTVNQDEDYQISGLDEDGSLTLKGDDAAANVQIKFQHAGVYRFTLKPVPEFHSAYVLDTTAYTLRFYVKNVDGGLKVSVTAQKSTDGSKASTVEFQNTFAPVMMDPPVSKKVVNEDGTPASSSDTFTFEVKPDQNGFPLPEGAENGVKRVQIQGSGRTEIGKIYFIQPGTYSYSLSEVQPGPVVSRYQYDQSIYRYTFTVTRASQDANDGSLKVAWTASNQNGNVVASGEGLQAAASDIVTFTNTLLKADVVPEDRTSESETDKPETEESETEKPKTPETNNNNNSSNNGVKTGDQTPIALYLSLAGAALVVIMIGLAVIRKRKRS